jgi:hypothetical protein
MRVAALEDNVAFLEQWCEEQQDVLDRVVGPLAYDYELAPAPPPRQILRVVDLRDRGPGNADIHGDDPGPDPSDGDGEVDVETVVAMVETEHDRRVRLVRARLNRLRRRLLLSAAGAIGAPAPPPPEPESRPVGRSGVPVLRRVSARQAGRTAP